MFCVFFFKQKTAYEMRISDWSSDVCSSDLAEVPGLKRLPYREGGPWGEHEEEAEPAEEHDHEGIDLHLWLDPDNAKAMVAAITAALSAADPDKDRKSVV